MNFFHHKDLENHLLQLCPKVVKHPVFTARYGLTSYTIKKILLVFKRLTIGSEWIDWQNCIFMVCSLIPTLSQAAGNRKKEIMKIPLPLRSVTIPPLWLHPDNAWNSDFPVDTVGTWLWRNNASFVVIWTISRHVHDFAISSILNWLTSPLTYQRGAWGHESFILESWSLLGSEDV